MRNREQSQSFPKAGATAPPLNGAEVEQAATATVQWLLGCPSLLPSFAHSVSISPLHSSPPPSLPQNGHRAGEGASARAADPATGMLYMSPLLPHLSLPPSRSPRSLSSLTWTVGAVTSLVNIRHVLLRAQE